MATSGLERITLNGLSLTGWGDIESLTFTPAAKKAQWAENPDADGAALVKESRYTNSYFELQVRAERQEDTEAALEHVGELLDAMQGCERARGGAESLWIPNETEPGYTFYAVMAEIVNVPIEVQGDMVGWMLSCPVLQIKVTARPFLYTAERTVVEAKESEATPAQEIFVKGIKGDVPAEARLIVKDKATQNRRYVQWGRDVVETEEPPACLITAASLVTEGFSGEAKTRSGAYSEEKVKRATAVSSATTICSTGSIKHVGSFAVYMRPYAGSTNARFRISYRNGDGPLIPLEWKTPPVEANFSHMFMGEVFLDEVEQGEQTSEIRIEHKTSGAVVENDVNYLLLLPSRASHKARGRAVNTPTKLLAYDEFLQTEGALSGKNLGGPGTITWSGAGDSDDFTVIAADDVARRTATSDSSLNAGRFGLAGSTEYESVQVSAVASSSVLKEEVSRIGVLARYVDTSNWLIGVLSTGLSSSGGAIRVWLEVIRCISGSAVALGRTELTAASVLPSTTVTLSVAASGSWTAESMGEGISGQSSTLATGGALAKGKVGIYDAWTSATACTRTLDSFNAMGADSAAVVCYSGKAIEFNSRGAERESSAGGTWGQPDLPRGANFYLEPEGADERINRIIVLMRRGDVEEEADSAVTDKHTVEIKVRERFLLPR